MKALLDGFAALFVPQFAYGLPRAACALIVGLATNCLKKTQEDEVKLYVHNRTPSKADALLQKGALWAPSPVRIAEQCSITFSCVFNDAALNEVFADFLNGKPAKGSIYADCSTVYPDTIRELASKAKAAGHSCHTWSVSHVTTLRIQIQDPMSSFDTSRQLFAFLHHNNA